MRISDWSSDVCSSDLLHDLATVETCCLVHGAKVGSVPGPAPVLVDEGTEALRLVGELECGHVLGHVAESDTPSDHRCRVQSTRRGRGASDDEEAEGVRRRSDRKSTRLNSSP